MNIYLELTQKFNADQLRVVLSGGQAVVLHRLAVMSKDGDWIIRENQETTDHILNVLQNYGARYRFGAPLDIRWLAGGWSSHFEFQQENIRVRTDFVSRPPRLDNKALEKLWKSQISKDVPKVEPRELAELKKTNREKDYAVIGELARLLTKPEDQFLYSRSARDLLALALEHPDLAQTLSEQRPALKTIPEGRDALEIALDAERRQLIRANEKRLAKYMANAARWADEWPNIASEIKGSTLTEAHRTVCRRAEGLLPFTPDSCNNA